jgi:uncharacterized membrane protein YkvA (DUF1232 family)
MSESWDQWYEPDRPANERLRSRLLEATRRSPRYAQLASGMMKDSRVPLRVKAVLGAGGAYAVWPIDLIPGFIPILGQLDDLIAITMALEAAMYLCPEELMDEHLERSELSRADVRRDAETARLAAKWVAGKGVHLAGAALGKGWQIGSRSVQRGLDRLSEQRSAIR